MINRKPTASTNDRRITALSYVSFQNQKSYKDKLLRSPAAIGLIVNAERERRIVLIDSENQNILHNTCVIVHVA
jgi:hypothetical protein